MTRGSKLSRAIEFFEEGDIREVRAAKIIVDEVMAKRLEVRQEPLPFHKKPRKPRAKKVGKAGDEPAEHTNMDAAIAATV